MLSHFLALALLTGAASAPDPRPRDFANQIVTVSNIDYIRLAINLYREGHGVPPPTLKTLQAAGSVKSEWLLDGWGRPIIYFTTGHSYLLLSLGRAGVPTSQQASPGGILAGVDYDANIVMIDGSWAQTPHDVDR
jgi:hypothetical protein